MSKKKEQKPQIESGVSNEDYHNTREYYNASRIKLAKKSLAHVKYDNDNYDPFEHQEKKLHFDVGSAFEIALTEPDKLHEKVIVMPEEDWEKAALEDNPNLKEPTRSAVYRKLKDQFIVDNEDKLLVTDEILEEIELMIESCFKNKLVKGLLNVPEEHKQMTFKWNDPNTGLPLKNRPDILNKEVETIIEIKTIEDGSPEKFSKQVANFDYPLQACLQIKAAIDTGFMKQVKNFFWLAVEKKPPYNATLYRFQQEDIEFGMQSLNHYIELIAEAESTGEWKGYEQRADNKFGIVDLEVPLFYRR